MKLAIVSTHPIQYNAPFFRLLAAQPGIDLRVFYTWEQSANGPKFDPGFGKKVEWDIPLLEGYAYQFVKNTAREPGSHHFRGIVNPGLIKTLEDWGPDVLLVYGWSFQSHLACMRHFHGKIPVWFRGDSTLLNETPGLRRLARRIFLKWVYSHVDLALYVGEHNRSYYEMHGLDSSRLARVPHAVDNQRFQHEAEENEKRAACWRKDLGIRESDIVLLFAGKLEPRKNPAFLVQMARHVKQENVRFLIVGNGPLEPLIEEWASADQRVIRMEFQNQHEMPAVYRLGDIFILPSRSETWGLGVNEAMACGRPVLISNRCGCAPDLVREGENGYVFPYDAPEVAAAKLDLMLAGIENLKSMGRESLRMIENFSVEEETRTLCRLLSEKLVNN